MTFDPPSGTLPEHSAPAGLQDVEVHPPVLDPTALRTLLDARIRRHRLSLARAEGRRPLHVRVPGLTDVVEYRRLADGLPTPVEELAIAEASVWVKRDDRSSSLYGGNKVRKLEYVLAQPARLGAVVVTGGGTASHHLLATVLYCALLGAGCAAAVFDQPECPGIERLSAVLAAFGVPVRRSPSLQGYPLVLARAMGAVAATRRRPWLLYPGASTPAGTLGYVGCGLEIAESVERGECPEPAEVYVPLGSGGTAVGLALGLALGGLGSRVVAVRVTDPLVNNRVVLSGIEAGTRALLALGGLTVPSALDRVRILDGYLGRGYGYETSEGAAALESAHRLGIPADQTYTAKALAATLDATRVQPASGPVMFVDTLSGADPLRA